MSNLLFTNANEFEAVDTGIAVPEGHEDHPSSTTAHRTPTRKAVSISRGGRSRLRNTTGCSRRLLALGQRRRRVPLHADMAQRQYLGQRRHGGPAESGSASSPTATSSVWSDNDSWDIVPFRVRFEIHEEVEVVTDATGTVVGGNGGDVDLELIEPFAIRGNTVEIPVERLPFSVPTWLHERLRPTFRFQS